MSAAPARGGQRLVPARLAVIALVMGLGLYRFAHTLADPDIWGHIAIGRLYHATGRIRQPDPFSYVTAGHEWINFEWLFELILYRIFAAVGPSGLIVLKVTVGLLLLGIIYRILCRQGLPPERAGIVVLAIIHFLVPFFLTVRPHLVTYGFFLAVLLLLRSLDRGETRWLYAAPPLFVLWANLHPGFLAGLGVLGIWTGLELGRRWLAGRGAAVRPSMWTVIPILVACVLATGLNPWGFSLLPFLWRTATVPRPEITEWQPLLVGSAQGVTYLAFAAATGAGWLYSRRPRSLPLGGVLAVCALLPLIAWRHVPLAVMAMAVLAGEHIGDAWARWASAHTRGIPRTSAAANRVLATAATIGAALFLVLALPRLGCIVIDPPSALGQPVRAIGLLRASGISANLAIDFDWGLYAMYHVAPTIKISMDGRRETAYDERAYTQNLDFKFGHGDWEALLRDYDTQLALVRRYHPSDNLLRLKRDWTLLYEDSLAVLFGRADLPFLDRIRATAPPALPDDGTGLCMP